MKKLPSYAQMDAAEARAATAMADPKTAPQQRQAAAEREMKHGAGLWTGDLEPEAAA